MIKAFKIYKVMESNQYWKIGGLAFDIIQRGDFLIAIDQNDTDILLQVLKIIFYDYEVDIFI